MNLQEIYDSVQEIPGWMLFEKLQAFEGTYSQLDKSKKHVAVEIGCYYGRSAISQGLIIKQLGLDCKLYAIDAFSKTATSEGTQSPENKEWWAKQNFSEVYHSFLGFIKKYELEDIVIPVVGKSVEVYGQIPDEISLMHQDGSHTPEVIKSEFHRYYPKMAEKSIWIADDWAWQECNEMYVQCAAQYQMKELLIHNNEGQSFAVLKVK